MITSRALCSARGRLLARCGWWAAPCGPPATQTDGGGRSLLDTHTHKKQKQNCGAPGPTRARRGRSRASASCSVAPAPPLAWLGTSGRGRSSHVGAAHRAPGRHSLGGGESGLAFGGAFEAAASSELLLATLRVHGAKVGDTPNVCARGGGGGGSRRARVGAAARRGVGARRRCSVLCCTARAVRRLCPA